MYMQSMYQHAKEKNKTCDRKHIHATNLNKLNNLNKIYLWIIKL